MWDHHVVTLIAIKYLLFNSSIHNQSLPNHIQTRENHVIQVIDSSDEVMYTSNNNF